VTAVVTQAVASDVPAPLVERLKALNVTLVSVNVNGRITVQGQARPLATKAAQWSLLWQTAGQYFDTLQAAPGQALAILPGVWLIAMPTPLRRPTRWMAEHDSLTAVMLIGPEFLEGEQFCLLCDQLQLDRQATIRSIDRGALVAVSEVLTELSRRGSELQTISSHLGDTYEELSLLYSLSSSMAVNKSPLTFLGEACRELREVLGLRWMALLLSEQEPGLNELAGQLVIAGRIDADESTVARVGRLLLAQQPMNGTPRVIDDTRSVDIAELPVLAGHILAVSLVREGKPFGILFGGDKLDRSSISSVDLKLCDSLANSTSIFLQNVMLYEDMQAMFMGTLRALSRAIDAKDSYTQGHSERVALVARMLAEASGMEPATIERVYISGLLHDVGKIGVPEAVLCKPGQLTRDEFELIKQHPSIGARILADIRQMHDLVPGVLSHHERWDGRGYPQELAGESIPLFGRLIGLADAFDAMSSNRTYRDALPHEQVMAEIRRNAGTQFDPALADLFDALDLSQVCALYANYRAKPAERQTA
jgi:hypothetical protein